MVMNKRSWIKVVEAFIAILIISAAIIFFSTRDKAPNINEQVYVKQKAILDIISNNDEFRNEIIGIDLSTKSNKCEEINKGSEEGNNDDANDKYEFIKFIEKSIPQYWEFTTNICEIDKIGNTGTPIDREVYVTETIITANYSDYGFRSPGSEDEKIPRKIRLFIWAKELR